MRGRTAARTAIIAIVAASPGLLTFAGLVLAKGEGIVTLAAPIPRDADPGSTLTVVFTVTGLGDADSRPVSGWPVVLRLTAPDGSYNESLGVERGASGTYVATIDVPAGGIASADFAVQGISTFADGSTVRSDMPLAVDGVLMTTTANPAPAPAAPPADPAAAAPAPDFGLALVGAVIAVGGGIIAGLLYLSGRRGSLRSA
jgi:hypothetical protein